MQISYTHSQRNWPEICRTSVGMPVCHSVQRDCYSDGLHDTQFGRQLFVTTPVQNFANTRQSVWVLIVTDGRTELVPYKVLSF